MAIIAFNEEARRALSVRGDVVEGQREWWFRTDSGSDIPAITRVLPAKFTPHPDDPRAVAMAPDIRQESRYVYRATMAYTSEVPQSERFENPLARPAVLLPEIRTEKRTLVFTWDGNPVINTAGDLIEGVTIDWEIMSYVAKKNVASIPTWAEGLMNRINAESFALRGITRAPKTIRYRNPNWGEELFGPNGVPYYEFSCLLEIDELTWDAREWNRGWRERIPVDIRDTTVRGIAGALSLPLGPAAAADFSFSDPPQIAFRLVEITTNGERPSEPAFLDKEGKRPRLSDFTVKWPLELKDLVELQFERYEPVSFTPLRQILA
ncbi:MAG: hypothetical protein HC841_00320 [Verrucomicrobiae bacterium]|nr:hypothetical protein [Verrucomicrobiae bacterium]